MQHTNSTTTLLRIDSSARNSTSVSRSLANELVQSLLKQKPNMEVVQRDLAANPPSFVSEEWVNANFTDEKERDARQKQVLAESDELVNELAGADIVVISMPLYNFSIPASLKAWVDMVARARLTFRFTDNGVEGLLKDKRVYVTYASGGVAQGSAMDHASGYMRHVLGFMGMSDIEFVPDRGEDYRA